MQVEYEKSIKPILDTFDRIREILRFEKIELPKIVVVGDQSSGKSSVLESITGVSLPRGENTVTKCPIILQMRSVTNPADEYAKVRIEGEKNERSKISLKQLNDEIMQLQEEVIKKSNLGITDTPIYAYVRKVGAPDVTLYDLPGITYKNENMISKIRELITKYTAGKETLILLVIPANSDFTTSEAISLIKKNSDYQDRTLGIITKIDLAATQERNLYRKIMENELDLKFNPIVVRNRTQEEIEKSEDFDIIRNKEMHLIDNCSDLKRLPDECKGTSQLITRLINIQREKLISSKHEIREKIMEKLISIRAEQSSLPMPAESISEKLDRFKECLTKLTTEYTNLLKGSLIYDSNNKNNNLGSRVREKFELFSEKFQNNNTRFFSDDFNSYVREILKESRGLKLPNFFDPSALHSIISKEISTVEKITLDLLMDVKDYIKDILLYLTNKSFNAYPNLNRAIFGEIKDSINTQFEEIWKMIKELIECEKEIEWTNNPYYMDVINKINSIIKERREKDIKISSLTPQQIKAMTQSVKENDILQINDLKINESEIFTKSILKYISEDDQHVQNIQVSCFSYWKLFEKRFIDYSQMIIVRKMIYYYQNELGLFLEKKFSPNSTNTNYISEDPNISKKRHDLETSMKNLEMAKDELNMIL